MTASNTPTLYRASHSTRHFEWEAYGETEDGARGFLIATLLMANTEFSHEELKEIREDAHVYPVRAGIGLRDEEPVGA